MAFSSALGATSNTAALSRSFTDLMVDRRDAQWVRDRRASNLPQAVVALVDTVSAIPETQQRHAA